MSALSRRRHSAHPVRLALDNEEKRLALAKGHRLFRAFGLSVRRHRDVALPDVRDLYARISRGGHLLLQSDLRHGVRPSLPA